MSYDGVLAESVRIPGDGGDSIEAYTARPLSERSRGGVVVIHHLPGYDRETKEHVRRFAVAGYDAICPNLYWREAPGADPSDAAAAARAAGGVPDERLLGDVAGAMRWLRDLTTATGAVATIGHCSGGRQSWLCAGRLDPNAAIVCYGAYIVGTPPADSPMRVSPLGELAASIRCPLLGLFGTEDTRPSPEQVDELEGLLREAGADYEFHRYDGAGHAFFSPDRPSYRPEAAVDGWDRIWAFLDRSMGA